MYYFCRLLRLCKYFFAAGIWYIVTKNGKGVQQNVCLKQKGV